MVRYTLEECYEQKICIWVTSKEEAIKISVACGGSGLWNPAIDSSGAEVLIRAINYPYPCEYQYGYDRNYYINISRACQCINYSQVLFEKRTSYELW